MLTMAVVVTDWSTPCSRTPIVCASGELIARTLLPTISPYRGDAIAAYLRGRGIAMPIRIEGWGETRLLVQTADGRVEPRNRDAEIVIEDR
jgi:hypothetical protein